MSGDATASAFRAQANRAAAAGESNRSSSGSPGHGSSAAGGGSGRPAASTSTSMSAPRSASGSSPGTSASGSASGSASSSVPSATAATGSGKVMTGAPRVRFADSPASGPGGSPGESREMAKVRELIGRQKWAEARDALQMLLMRSPADRANQAQLAYVRGREALELGNLTEARRELARALSLEPTMEQARAALAEIDSPFGPPLGTAPRR